MTNLLETLFVSSPGRLAFVQSAGDLSLDAHYFTWLDYGTLIGYLVLLTAVGFYFSRREATTNDYFLGGQRIPFWAAGISIMATQISSVGFMAIPAKSYATNWAYFTGVLTWFFVVPIVIWAFIPFFRRLNVTSAYEYLEKRFDVKVRLFVASLYCVFQLVGRMGIILYLPALALSAVTGISPYVSVLIMGVLSTLYTVLGGMEAVIWTDFIQALVLFGGALLCIVFVVSGTPGGVGDFFSVAQQDHKFSLGEWNWDLTAAVVWTVFIGNIFNRLGTLTSDQSVVQRYLTTRNEREAKRALWANVAASVPWAVLIYSLGTALYVYYDIYPERLDTSLATDGIVPFFIATALPPGVSGLIIAGIFAAAMSSLDSSMHSVSTVLMTDFYQRFKKKAFNELRLARWLTGLLGAFGTLIALLMISLNIQSMFDLIIQFAGLFGGAMTGVFVLGIFTTRANATGTLIGAVASGVLLFYVERFTDLHFFLYGGIGLISCFAVGYLASWWLPGKSQLEGLTLYNMIITENKN